MRRGSVVDQLIPRAAPGFFHVVRPSATDATPPRYPHMQGESVTHRTARSAGAIRRERGERGGWSSENA